MMLKSLFKGYQGLVAATDQAFEKMQWNFGEFIRCRPGCSDCCHAPFGLFLIEAAYLKTHFDRLYRKGRREASLLISVSKALQIPLNRLKTGIFE